MQLNRVNWSVARILYGHAFNSQCSDTNRLVDTATMNNVIHYSKKNREVKMYSNATLKCLRIINISMYYVILSSLWKDNTEGALFMLRRCVFCTVGAIKHAICSLPLAPNAQRANLTLTSNPLTRKRTNACRVYSAFDKQIHFLCAYVEWCSIDDESPIFYCLPNLL